MKVIFSIFLFLITYSAFGYELTFEIVKKSDKEYPKQKRENEFLLLEKNTDTSNISFIATVKVKGNEITLPDLYFKLREESKKLGANCFYLLKPAYGIQGYYLLCNIYLSDSATLTTLVKRDTNSGKIFIIKPDDKKYVGKSKVQINDSINIELLSGTYYVIKIKDDNEQFKIKKGRSIKKIYGKKNAVTYVTTSFPHGNAGLIIPIAVMTGGVGASAWLLSHKTDHYFMEPALGKLMLVFYTRRYLKTTQ
jgi:hypothetical protein